MKRVLVVLVLIVTVLVLTAGPAAAWPYPAKKIFGCDGYLQWPCPGPAL